MNYNQLIIKKREDMGKIYIFFPHKGTILETECNDVNAVYNLLEYIKNKHINELENFSKDKRISKETLDTVKEIYLDLKDIGINFNTL
ncbi:hypothetical protein Mia14_0615 [Candidatus Mancarchaeum acidiphilum]|uniref:PqqD family protein n=1 Tax=Candidatus Mancarchaeum acidiphilum TaxID=1920749 RepID=A0A218NN71_9ARCH|nr:hypothetical protein [Candidatus Mancarchaeum acidiphilum]ASI13918.1 hypothetical protein Mia14_0615 [Candidatus Mancarchaeum acidiphilum]